VSNRINEKKPLECTNIVEVRNEIDNIDREIVRLLAERLGYVKEVIKYKEPTPEAILATERRAAVLKSRREWAEELGFNPAITEEIYKILIGYCIEEETKLAAPSPVLTKEGDNKTTK